MPGVSFPESALEARVVMAMPMGPPYGGMTSNAAILRRSALFDSDRTALVDTTPRGATTLARAVHSAKLFARLFSTIRAHRAEVVFFSSSSFLGFYEKATMGLACRSLGVKTVVHLVGSFMEFREQASRLERRAIDRLVSSFDRVLVVSESFRAYFAREIPSAEVRIVPNPVDCAQFPVRATPPRHDREVQILFAGAMVEGKGILDLIAAAEIARPQLGHARIVCIGGGPLEDDCRRRIAAAGLEATIELRGFVDEAEKKRLFASSEIFVLPSHFEALPVSVLEAASTGLAVIATDVGGVRSAVEDGVTGLVIPPREPEQIARALVRLVGDADLRRSMGAAGAARVRARYDAPIVASLLIETFNALAARPARRGGAP